MDTYTAVRLFHGQLPRVARMVQMLRTSRLRETLVFRTWLRLTATTNALCLVPWVLAEKEVYVEDLLELTVNGGERASPGASALISLPSVTCRPRRGLASSPVPCGFTWIATADT